MTPIPTKSELQILMEPQHGPCISLFLPTERAGVETRQNFLRLSYLIREAESHLLLNNLPVQQRELLLKPIRTLLDCEPLWLHPSDVLAGVAYLFPLYREANTYAHLLKEGVPGNPDRTSLETLHEQGWAIAAPFFLRRRQEETARYKEYAATGRALHSLRSIIPAAYDGRIESLFLRADQEQWGTFNPATRALHVHLPPRFNDDDLLDIAATQTLLHGGSVYVVERADMPDEGPLAAVLRY